MTPPNEAPATAMPTASPSLVVKYVGGTATHGTNRHPAPMPTTKPWHSSACQYVVHRLSIIRPKTMAPLPATTSVRR